MNATDALALRVFTILKINRHKSDILTVIMGIT